MFALWALLHINHLIAVPEGIDKGWNSTQAGAPSVDSVTRATATMRKDNRARRKRRLTQRAAQKKHRREKARVQGKRRTLGPKLQLVPNPFEGLSDEQRRQVFEEIAGNSEREYQEALGELRAILRRHHPLLVLSHMSCYGLSVAVDEAAGITKLDGDYEILPYHVEILQALLLQINPDELSGEPFSPHVLM